MRKHLALTILTTATLLISATALSGDRKVDGKVAFESTSINAGIGISWGNGTLTMNSGEQRGFSVKGLDVGSAGVTKVTATGEVYGLNTIDDFSGKYAGVDVGLAVVAGGDRIAVKNQKGVIMVLDTVEEGIKLATAGKGLEIELK